MAISAFYWTADPSWENIALRKLLKLFCKISTLYNILELMPPPSVVRCITHYTLHLLTDYLILSINVMHGHAPNLHGSFFQGFVKLLFQHLCKYWSWQEFLIFWNIVDRIDGYANTGLGMSHVECSPGWPCGRMVDRGRSPGVLQPTRWGRPSRRAVFSSSKKYFVQEEL